MGGEWYEAQGIEVRDTDRGGRVTYHGPGQLVAYPIVSLRPYGDDVHEYVRRLERVMIEALAEHGVEAGTIEGLTGVWTPSRRAETVHSAESAIGPGGAKIGSIGVHVSRGVTTHGLAVNVNNDLQPFEWIVPCGIEGCRVTSLRASWAPSRTWAPSPTPSSARFAAVYDRVPVADRAGRAGARQPLGSASPMSETIETETAAPRRRPSASTSPAPAPSRAAPPRRPRAPSPSSAPASRRG